MIEQVSYIDICIIIIFMVAIVWWAIKHGKSDDAQSYFLAGKGSSWWVIGLTLFAASISSSTLIGHAGECFISGIAVFNYNLMAVFVMIFIALFFLPFYIKTRIYTIPEFLGRRFDDRSRVFFSFISIIGNVFLDAAATLYTGALIIKIIFPDVDIFQITLIMAVVAGSYTIIGGLSSVIYADIIQSIVLIVGSIILSYTCFDAIGGWGVFVDRFQDGVWLNLIRGNDDPTVPWLGLFLGIPILSFYFWGNNQVMVQRILSAKSIDEGRKGVLFVGFLYMFTLFIIMCPGLIARALDIFTPTQPLPNKIVGGQILLQEYGVNTNEVYPRLIVNLLPTGLIGLIMAAMISALVSTLSATLSSISTLFTMDFYNRWFNKGKKANLVKVGRITSIVALVIAVAWTPFIQRFDSLVGYYQEMISYLAPPIVGCFIMGVFWRRTSKDGAFIGLLFGMGLSIFLMVCKYVVGWDIGLHYLIITPILMAISMVVIAVVSLLTKQPDDSVIKEMIWTKKLWQEESVRLKDVKWYSNFRYLALLLIIACIIEYIYFS